MKKEEIEVSRLWKLNCRPWVQHLEDCFISGVGKDFDTIEYWVSQFESGESSTLVVDIDYTIIDGHHRLIAATVAGLETINVIVCPQRTTYK